MAPVQPSQATPHGAAAVAVCAVDLRCAGACLVGGAVSRFEDEARDAIHKALAGVYKPVYAAGAAFATAHKEVMAMTNLDNAMSSVLGAILAAEALKEAAAAAEKTAREALSAAFQETGAPEVITMRHKAYMSKKPAFVSMDQPDLVPETYKVQPPPEWDMKRIKADLENKILVPGATLVRPNSMTLNIRSRK